MPSDSSSPPTLPSGAASRPPEGGAVGSRGTELLAVETATAPCTFCGKPLVAGEVRCRYCRSVLGEVYRCPHCHAIADLEPSKRLRFLCKVCGKPRVPNEDPSMEHIGHPEIEALRSAGSHASAATAWLVSAIVAACLAVFSSLALALVITLAANALLGAAALGTAAIPLAFALLAAQKSRSRRSSSARFLEQAWGQVALECARLRQGAIDARTFSLMTRITPAEAEQILARVSAQSRLAGHVIQDGTLRYRLLDSSAHATSPYETKRTDPA